MSSNLRITVQAFAQQAGNLENLSSGRAADFPPQHCAANYPTLISVETNTRTERSIKQSMRNKRPQKPKMVRERHENPDGFNVPRSIG
jgi:hypothetical protein